MRGTRSAAATLLVVLALVVAALVVPYSLSTQETRPISVAHVILLALVLLHIARARPPGRGAFVASVALVALLATMHPIAVVVVAMFGALWLGAWIDRDA